MTSYRNGEGINARLSAAQHQWLWRYSRELGMTRSEVVRMLIDQEMEGDVVAQGDGGELEKSLELWREADVRRLGIDLKRRVAQCRRFGIASADGKSSSASTAG